jgi:hypothetical protein
MKAARAAARNIFRGRRWFRPPVSEPQVPELTSTGTPLKKLQLLDSKGGEKLEELFICRGNSRGESLDNEPGNGPTARQKHALLSVSGCGALRRARRPLVSSSAWRHNRGRHDHDWDRDGHHRDFVIWNNQPFIVEDTRTTGVEIIRRRFTAGPSTTSRSW